MRGLIRRIGAGLLARRAAPEDDLAELLTYYAAVMDAADGIERLRRLVALEAWCEGLCYHRGWDYPPWLPRHGRVEWGPVPRWAAHKKSRP